jgi:cytochrome P450
LIKIGFGFDLNGMVESDHVVPFVDAFNEVQQLIHERTKDPLGIEALSRHWQREKRIKYCGRIIDDFTDEIINATRSRENQGRPDFVSSFLYHCDHQGKTEPTNEEIRDLVIEMVIRGRDSVAAALSWTIFELTKHPQVAERIREEVYRVCRGSQLSYDLVQNLPYTQAVVMESLRLHPPVPNTFRLAKNDDTLPDGTKIPAGSMVFVSDQYYQPI